MTVKDFFKGNIECKVVCSEQSCNWDCKSVSDTVELLQGLQLLLEGNGAVEVAM